MYHNGWGIIHLVEFRSVDEARCEEDGIQGSLFNDPMIQILYSNSDIGPMDNSKDTLSFMTQFRGSLPHETPSRSGSQFGSIERFGPAGTIDSSNPPGTNVHVHPVGPRGFDEHHATEGRISLSRPEMFHNFLDVNVNSPRPGGGENHPLLQQQVQGLLGLYQEIGMDSRQMLHRGNQKAKN
jgi:hypothetical protein